MNRRQLLALLASSPVWLPGRATKANAGVEFPVTYRKPTPYDELRPLVDASKDKFRCEVEAARLESALNELTRQRSLPVDSAWFQSLGEILSNSYVALPENRVRYEIKARRDGKLSYRVGCWRVHWNDSKIERLETLEESVVDAPAPLFEDATAELFGDVRSFQDQLVRGIPYWRSRLDAASGIDVFGNCGIAIGDADGDGWDEIYVCQPAGLPNRLYHRRADGKWEDITDRSGVGILDATTSALFLDLRNSGNQDLVVLTNSAPLLFLNTGSGRYRHIPDAFRFSGPIQGTLAGMAAADFDRDGKLDVYFCSYLYFQSEDQYRYPTPYHDAQNGPPNFLFRNRLNPDGTGFFQDVTAATGININNNRYSFAAAWCDYDGDGWPDLYVANDFGRNNLYKNEGGRFSDVARETGVEDIGPGMSAAWFDYDGDGRPDLYVSNMWTAAGKRVSQDSQFGPIRSGVDPTAYHGHTKGNSLYRNLGNGKFESTADQQKIEMGRWAWSADGIDFDLDGIPEIYVTAGMITHTAGKDLNSFFWRQVVDRSPSKLAAAPAYENGWNTLNQLIREDWSWNGDEANVFYRQRNGQYVDCSGISGVDASLDSRAFAVVDLDGDGHPDLVLKNRLGPQLMAFRNNSVASANVIAIELHGTKSNRDGIGARVEVEWGNRRSAQWLSAGSGYISQHTKRLFFGTGDSNAARVKITWPSGMEQRFENVPAGHTVRISEGSDSYTKQPLAKRSALKKRAAMKGVNDLVFEPTWLLEPLPLPEAVSRKGFICLTDGPLANVPTAVPFEVRDLRKASPDSAAVWALFRRYLFDYRAPLKLPLLLLADDDGRLHKIYPSIPDTATLQQDLAAMTSENRDRLALPFSGAWHGRPSRNYFKSGAPFVLAGYSEQALPYLTEALRREPENFKAQLTVGQIHLEAGRLDDAGRHLSAAAPLNPGSPELWNNLGGLEMARKNYKSALDHFNKAMEINPDLPYVLVNTGQVQARLGNDAIAERLFRRALDLAPKDPDAANHLGLLLAKQDRTDEAATLLKMAIETKRDHAAAINNLAVLYIRMHKIEDAIQAFRYGIKTVPDYDTFYMNLARVYVDLGQPENARGVLEQLIERRPDHTGARSALAGLNKAR